MAFFTIQIITHLWIDHQHCQSYERVPIRPGQQSETWHTYNALWLCLLPHLHLHLHLCQVLLCHPPHLSNVALKEKSTPLKNLTVHSTVIILKIYNMNSGFVTGWHYMPSFAGKKNSEWSNKNWRRNSILKKYGILSRNLKFQRSKPENDITDLSVVVVHQDPGWIRGNIVTMKWYISLLSSSCTDVPTNAILVNVQINSESYHLVHLIIR